uniref:Retrotransposon gag domain-containing protein n=1 Tax=Caenorhabditis japonica TaxID=281687 RepID=A0A8R1DY47_CAEJA
MSPPRRVTRSMSASQQPRINVFTMKSAATVPIFSGTNKENFHTFVRNFKDHVRLTRDPDDNEVRNHLLTVLTDFARDTAEEVLERNPDASSDDIIDALRAQYEDQYSTQYRLDAIKACFQYAQEPVQDFYQRVRKLMREAQTGANRAEVIRVGKQAFLEGLQPEIRFFVTTAKSSEFEQVYKDAIFFEKALLDKERKDKANATAVANRPKTAEVFAQAVQQHREFYDYDNEEGYPMVASVAPRGQGQFQQQGTPRRTQYNSSYQGYRASANRSFNRDQNQRHSQFRVLECWYCMRPGHYRFECQTRKEDISRGILRNSVDDPQIAPPGAASADNHDRRPPRNPVDNHQQFTVKALHASPSEQIRQQPPSSDEETRALVEQQAHTIKMQANQLKDIKWRLHAYHMEETPSESPSPSVNVFATNNENPEPPKTVSHTKTSFITAQIPITANGHPCHALIDTGANITVTSETSIDLF